MPMTDEEIYEARAEIDIDPDAAPWDACDEVVAIVTAELAEASIF